MSVSYTIEIVKVFVEKEESGWFCGLCKAIPDPSRDRKLDFPGEMGISGVFQFRAEGVPYRIEADLGEYRRKPQLSILKGSIPERIESLVDLDGIDRYLDFIKRSIDANRKEADLKPSGIGPVKIRNLVNQWGLNSIQVARENPKLIAAETKGWNSDRAEILAEELINHIESEQTMMQLVQLGANRALSPKNREELFERYGKLAPDKIRKDPYKLIKELRGYGWEKADTLSVMNLLWPESSPARIQAGTQESLRVNERDGHCYIATSNLIRKSSKLTGQDKRYHSMLIDGDEEIIQDGRFAYLTDLKEAEDLVVEVIHSKADQKRLPERITEADRALSKSLNTLQKEAFNEALKGGFLIITGGPGRGKTHACKSIIEALNTRGRKVLILAPTGRAAARAKELTGCPALTIHSYLARNKNDSFSSVSTFIIDESSMIDIYLMALFLKSLRKGQSCVFLGDVDQLPPVSAGTPFHSIIEADIIHCVKLTQIMRTDKRGLIEAASITNSGLSDAADRLRRISCESFSFLNCEGDEAREVVIKLVKTLVDGGTSPHSIQVITATNGYKSPSLKMLSNRDFNLELSSLLNPDGELTKATGKGDPLSIGDRVMNLVNNSKVKLQNQNDRTGSLMNGEIGFIRSIHTKELASKKPDGSFKTSDHVECDFQGRIIHKEMSSQDLVQCYAATCHKFQGSESPVVIVCFDRSASRILDRSWLYTAITRASTQCFLIAPSQLVNHACSVPGKIHKRRSFLLNRLLGIHDSNKPNQKNTNPTLEM